MRSYRKKRGRRRTRKNSKRFYFIGGQGNDKCVFVPLGGGLGNQLYVYAASLVVKRKTGLPICLLPWKGNLHSTVDYTVELFKEGRPVHEGLMEERIKGSKKLLEKVKNPHNAWNETNINANGTTNATLSGAFFQSYSSIKDVIPDMRKSFAEIFAKKYPEFKEKVESNISAFMHVRRGDYGSVSLSADYYNKGLAVLEPVEAVRTLYILSDDLSWCRGQEWVTGKHIVFFDEKDELKTMYLMSLCLAGAVISASTFSSWGAILGADQNPDSTIVYPAGWITGPSSRIQFPERWKSV
jgi:hypothetical protein